MTYTRMLAAGAALLLTGSLSCETIDEAKGLMKDSRAAIKDARAKADRLEAALEELAEAGSESKAKAESAAGGLSKLGASAGGVPASGGEVKQTSETVDVDGDGDTEELMAIDYGETVLWLWQVETTDDSFCGSATTLNFVVTDKPPTKILAFGQWDESCGAVSCPGNPETVDVAQCRCQDASGAEVDCGLSEAPAEGEGEVPTEGEGEGPTEGEGEGPMEGEGEGPMEGEGEGPMEGEGEGEYTCADIELECEDACQDDPDFDLCVDDCLLDAGC